MRGKDKRLLRVCFFLLTLFYFNCAFGSKTDTEYWQYINWKNWEHGPYKLYTIGEIRLNKDISRVYYYRITENFSFQAFPGLDLEAHYSYITNKSKGATQFKHTSRLELEVNPTLNFDNGISATWRNRLELLKKQRVSHIQFVVRHRALLSFPIENWGCLTSIKTYDEVFYDFDTNKFTQNRFVPFQLSFVLHRDLTINMFLMLRNFFSFSTSKWNRSIVLGTEVQF